MSQCCVRETEQLNNKKVKVICDGEETQVELLDSDYSEVSEEWN